MILRLMIAVLGLLAAASAAPAEELSWSGPLAVAAVPAGDRLQLEDGREVRLAGIRLPVAGEDAGTTALARAAQQALAERVAGRRVRLAPAAPASDRYGRLVAQVERAEDGLWLQGALLEQGLAQVQTRPGEALLAAEMLARERAARAAGLGLWRDPAFAPRTADRLAGATGSFRIVQGEVVRVAPTERYLYLNFGSDWRRDFTVRLRRGELVDAFARSGIAVEQLAGRRLEVRGLVLEAGGPLIEVSHPEQIEVLP